MNTLLPLDQVTIFYDSVCILATDGINKLLEHVSNNKYVEKYFEFPEMNIKNDMPSFYESRILSEVLDFRSIFSRYNIHEKIDIKELAGYDNYIKQYTEVFSLSNDTKYILEEENDYDEFTNSENYLKEKFICKLINRYVHINGFIPFETEKFKPIFELAMNRYSLPSLVSDLAIPILNIKFDVNVHIIDDKYKIIKMDEPVQLARVGVKFGASVKKSVMHTATHMLLIEGATIKNCSNVELFDTLCNINAYPLEIFDLFFAAIRLTTDAQTGYAQILSIAKDWGYDFKAYLPDIYGLTVRMYPLYFDNPGRPQVNILTETDLAEITRIYDKLLMNEDKKLKIAISRLNSSCLRANISDMIIDIVIAIETLLSDNDKGELTYKISSRMAAIISVSKIDRYTPLEAYNSMQVIYGYRSDIAHGREPKEKKLKIKIKEKTENTYDIAIDLAKIAIKSILDNPKFLNCKEIDNLIISSLK